MLMTIIMIIQKITLRKVLKYSFWLIVTLYTAAWVEAFVQLTVEFVWICLFNKKTTRAVKRWCEKRYTNTYKEDTMVEYKGDIIDISSILNIAPKLSIKINIFTGKVDVTSVVIRQRLREKFIIPRNPDSKREDKVLVKKEVKKDYIYCQALINSLNIRYANWQKNNPELIVILEKEEIAERELLEGLLKKFRV